MAMMAVYNSRSEAEAATTGDADARKAALTGHRIARKLQGDDGWR
jgi:hypothetical protein